MGRDALAAAFRATTYQVETADGVFGLRLGELNPAFDAFLARHGASRWALLTACNPGAVRQDDENPERQRRLQETIEALGWTSFPSLNSADDGKWPEEPGFLLLHVGEEAVRALGREFSQLACVCGETGAPPRLVWMLAAGEAEGDVM
jgi:hypothetical protein